MHLAWKIILGLLWALTAICAVGGGIFAALAVLGSSGAPQQAAAAAIGACCAVVPYVVTRSLSEIGE